MAYMEAVKDRNPGEDLFDRLFRRDYEGMEDGLIKVA